MSYEISSLPAFREAIETGASIAVNPYTGACYTRWKITQLIRCLFGFTKQDDLTLAQFFNAYLTSLEVKSSTFTKGFSKRDYNLTEINQTIDAIKLRLRTYLDVEKAKLSLLKQKQKTLTLNPEATSDAFKKIADAIQAQKKSNVAHQSLAHLQKQLIALKYRAISQNHIHHPQASHGTEKNQEWLKTKILAWKKEQSPALAIELCEDELRKIEATCHYPETISLLKKSYLYRENYFRFVFRNTVNVVKDAVDIAIQFPSIQTKISESFLDKRIKRLQNNGLYFHERAEKATLAKKDVTFLINGKQESILTDSKKITFNNGVILTIKEIFKSFALKNKKMGDLEYLAEGISLVYPQTPQVDLTKKEWWKDLPQFETLSKKDLEKRYKVSLKTTEGLITVKASKQHKETLHIQDNHSWFEIALPNNNGTFSILPFGKYAEVYPKGLLDSFRYIFQTKRAKLCFPDENEFYYHREHKIEPYVANALQLEQFMDLLRQDLLKAREGNMIFQAQGNNCAAWVQETMDTIFPEEKAKPRLFEVSILKTASPFPVSCITSNLRATAMLLGHKIANCWRIFICTLFGAWQGCTIKVNGVPTTERLIYNPIWLKGNLSLPAQLFHRVKEVEETITPYA
ncbi:MAG: hypothetical protein JWO53_1134 [Chlamydiia bacterium]|nr:hypothetical protein [Chlamydiia bacterium]